MHQREGKGAAKEREPNGVAHTFETSAGKNSCSYANGHKPIGAAPCGALYYIHLPGRERLDMCDSRSPAPCAPYSLAYSLAWGLVDRLQGDQGIAHDAPSVSGAGLGEAVGVDLLERTHTNTHNIIRRHQPGV
jgi:hypothetical protein